MSGVATAIVASAVIGGGTAAYAGHQSRKAAKSAADRLNNLKYEEDPDYTETQAKLKELGMDFVDGDIPDYYKGIGETGSQSFEDMLALTTRDIEKATAENLASGGRARGGQLGASTAGAVADASIKARYGDYTRALNGKEWLFGQGRGMLEGVRSAGFNEGAAKNQLEASKAGAMIDLDFYKADQKSQEVAAYGDSLTDIVDGLFGAGGALTKKKAPTSAKPNGVSSLGAIDNYGDLGSMYDSF